MILTENGTAPSPDNFKAMEAGLLMQTGGKLAVWSGRAATAFYHAYQLAMRRRPDIKAPEVIMPAMSCTTAANVAAMMGIKPRFADIQIHDALPTLDSIQARFSSNTIAVVAIHLFGNILELDAIKSWCKAKNLWLIEDPTQALGARFGFGEYVGSKGDVAIYSFNKTKMVELGNGILIANDDDIAADLEKVVAEEETPFPNISDEERKQLALNYRDMHHSLVSVLRASPENAPIVSQSFLEKRPEFEALYLRPVNDKVHYSQVWDDLSHSYKHRRAMAKIYYQKLVSLQNDNKLVFVSDAWTQTSIWRFSLRIEHPSKQVAFSEAVRKDGFHVSNLYWPVNQFFNPSDECPNADWLARRIINLWVDSSVDEDYVERCAASVVRHAEAML